MENDQDHIEYITQLLESKSTAKQKTYKHLLEAFNLLKEEALCIVQELQKKAHPGDDDVTVAFTLINEHEFHVKVAGDLLIFVLHTNVVTFDEGHFVMKDAYTRQNEYNRYYGQIMIYNFMADSLKFNRINDPGYFAGAPDGESREPFFCRRRGAVVVFIQQRFGRAAAARKPERVGETGAGDSH